MHAFDGIACDMHVGCLALVSLAKYLPSTVPEKMGSQVCFALCSVAHSMSPVWVRGAFVSCAVFMCARMAAQLRLQVQAPSHILVDGLVASLCLCIAFHDASGSHDHREVREVLREVEGHERQAAAAHVARGEGDGVRDGLRP